jgi:hypothetical protein
MVLESTVASFLKKLNEVIGDMQEKGFTVEILYSATILRGVFSAVVIGRE